MVRMAVAILAWGCLLAQAEDLRERLLRCGKIEDAELRLAAFDQVAKESAEQAKAEPESSQPLDAVPAALPPTPPPPVAVASAPPRATGPFGIDLTGVQQPRNQGKWKTDSWRSEMDDKRVYRTYLAANELVYASENYYPFLQVRYQEGKLEVYITYDEVLSAGSIAVATRIGKGAPVSQMWLTSSDFKAAFYPGDPRPFLQALCRDPKLVVRLTPYGQNPRTVTFDTRGLVSILQSMAKAVEGER